MNFLNVNLYNMHNDLSFCSRRPKINKDKVATTLQEIVTPATATAVTAVTLLTTLTGRNPLELDAEEIQRDIDSGMSLQKIANKYNTKISTVRVFMRKHHLSTSDGQILKTITREDLQSCIESNMSAKEIATRYGLSNVGSLSPLYKSFGLSAPTQNKVNTINIDEIIECKKKRMTDVQIADKFQVAFQFIAAKLKAHGAISRNTEQCRGYTMDEVQEMVNKNSLESVADLLGYTPKYFKQLLKTRGIAIPLQNEMQAFYIKQLQLKEKIKANSANLKNKNFWDNIKITKKNVSFYTKVIERNDLNNLDWDDSPVIFYLSKYNCWQDAEKIIDTIPKDNPLNLNGEDIINVIQQAVAKDNRNEYSDFTNNTINLYNYVIENSPETSASDFIKLVSLRRTDKELDKISKDKNLQPYKQMLMYSNMNGEYYINLLELLSINSHFLVDEKVQSIFNSKTHINPQIINKILSDENLTKNLDILTKNYYAQNENYIDLLDTLSKKPELLYFPKVRAVLQGYPPEASFSANLLNSIIQKIDDTNNIEQVIKYMDGNFVSNIYSRKKLGISYFIPSFMQLSPKLINNQSLMNYFDVITLSLNYNQAKLKIKFLQEVDANTNLVNDEEFMKNLALRVLSIKEPKDIQKQLNI